MNDGRLSEVRYGHHHAIWKPSTCGRSGGNYNNSHYSLNQWFLISPSMAANAHRGRGSFYGDAAPYRSREGLSTRMCAGSEEIQLHIDPMDLDDEISGLHGQVRKLRNIAEEIGTEVKYQKDFLEQLQMTMIKAQAGVKNNLRRLNKSIIQNGSNHIVHVVVFALVCFFLVYIWSKMSRK